MKANHLIHAPLLAGSLLIAGSSFAAEQAARSSSPPQQQMAQAVLSPTAGHDVSGTVVFIQKGNHVTVVADIKGLRPGSHGFHIHENGDCSAPDARSAGGHFNPTGQPHGARTDEERHVGDMGNLMANTEGLARLKYDDKHLTLSGPNSIVGKAVIVHADHDDFESQPSGNAGKRVACGVIEVTQASRLGGATNAPASRSGSGTP